MSYKPQFRKGRCYLRLDGKPVRIIKECDEYGPEYRTVQGDDGEARWADEHERNSETGEWVVVRKWFPGERFGYRYDRASDPGRCTASQPGEPRNLVVGSNWTLRAIVYRIKCTMKDWGKYYLDKCWTDALYCGHTQ